MSSLRKLSFIIKNLFGQSFFENCQFGSYDDNIDQTDDGVELIKQGFTFEFMKNALIRPVLCLKNRKLLRKWWKKVEKG